MNLVESFTRFMMNPCDLCGADPGVLCVHDGVIFMPENRNPKLSDEALMSLTAGCPHCGSRLQLVTLLGTDRPAGAICQCCKYRIDFKDAP